MWVNNACPHRTRQRGGAGGRSEWRRAGGLWGLACACSLQTTRHRRRRHKRKTRYNSHKSRNDTWQPHKSDWSRHGAIPTQPLSKQPSSTPERGILGPFQWTGTPQGSPQPFWLRHKKVFWLNYPIRWDGAQTGRWWQLEHLQRFCLARGEADPDAATTVTVSSRKAWGFLTKLLKIPFPISTFTIQQLQHQSGITRKVLRRDLKDATKLQDAGWTAALNRRGREKGSEASAPSFMDEPGTRPLRNKVKWSFPMIKRTTTRPFYWFLLKGGMNKRRNLPDSAWLYRQRCYVTPSVHAPLPVSCFEQRSERRPQHLHSPRGRFPAGRRAASASDSSLEGLAAASKSQSILLLLQVIRRLCGHTLALRRLVRRRALRDYGGATERKGGSFHRFDFDGIFLFDLTF